MRGRRRSTPPDIGRSAAGLRRRPLRGLRRQARSRSSPTTSSSTTSRANVAAVRDVVARARPDVALANHLVMGPAVLARALGDDVPYAVKIHGWALEYTVKPHPERFLPVRARGAGRRRAACWSARATRGRACGRRWTTRAVRERTRLGPPGVDVDEFAPARAGGRPRRAASPRRAAADRAGRGVGLLRARPGGGRARAQRRRRPAGRLRRQADRLQGRRAAAGRLAAGARASTPTRGW